MSKITSLVIGAGDRGVTYSRLGKHRLIPVAVAEPRDDRRKLFADEFVIPEDRQFRDYKDALEIKKIADICIITTPDELHFEPAKLAIEKGYDILLEKPIANKKDHIIMLKDINSRYGRFIGICHVLRFAPFYVKLKKIIDSGIIGDIVTIEHSEGVGWWHFAHSYVRGNWRDIKKSSPTILAKSCHDMDLLIWLTNKKCMRVFSFGGLKHFKKENAPINSAEYCINCELEGECPYSAKKLYMNMDITSWPVTVITDDLSYQGRLKAIKEGPYGKCVYRCDNNAVDHQVVAMEFESGLTASFTMSAFTVPGRKIRIMGTHGELLGNEKTIVHSDFRTGKQHIIEVSSEQNSYSGHGGGDSAMLNAYLDALEKNDLSIFSSTLEESIQSHIIAFAAEESRLTNKPVSLLF